MVDNTTATAQINTLLQQANHLLDQAARIADATGTSFYWDHLGYGFGGRYEPKVMTYDDAVMFIESGKDMSAQERENIVAILREGSSNSWRDSDTGWISSSSDC